MRVTGISGESERVGDLNGRVERAQRTHKEEFYQLLDPPDSLAEMRAQLLKQEKRYNTYRPHQALGYQTPNHVYNSGVGGGALIVDRFGEDDEQQQEKSNTGQPRAADAAEMNAA